MTIPVSILLKHFAGGLASPRSVWVLQGLSALLHANPVAWKKQTDQALFGLLMAGSLLRVRLQQMQATITPRGRFAYLDKANQQRVLALCASRQLPSDLCDQIATFFPTVMDTLLRQLQDLEVRIERQAKQLKRSLVASGKRVVDTLFLPEIQEKLQATPLDAEWSLRLDSCVSALKAQPQLQEKESFALMIAYFKRTISQLKTPSAQPLTIVKWRAMAAFFAYKQGRKLEHDRRILGITVGARGADKCQAASSGILAVAAGVNRRLSRHLFQGRLGQCTQDFAPWLRR